jgi:hypothetical protein
MDKLERLNSICRECITKKTRTCISFNPRLCKHCPTGQEIHKLDIQSQNGWEKIDWTLSRFKKFYLD